MNGKKAIFTGGLRTPFGRAFKGAYKDIRPDDLLIKLFRAQAEKFPDAWRARPEDVLVGCAYPEGEQGYNVARTAALGAGLTVPGLTINRLCASSLEALTTAAARIKAGFGERFLVGGIESMSRIPRRGAHFSESEEIKKTCPQAYITMGETAEEVSKRYGVGRTEQEDVAEASHALSFRAYEAGFYKEQIFPHLIERDEFIRYPVDRAKMASLEPAFLKDGVVTAATSSPLTDGATSGWVVSSEQAAAMRFTDGLEVEDVAWAHVSPEVMGLGPVPAIRALFGKNRLSPKEIDAFEINEAFAVQMIVCVNELSLPQDRVNAWGGALAVGHPLGASGLRLVMTLHHRLRALGKDGALGIAALCVGGGQGVAVLFTYRKKLF